MISHVTIGTSNLSAATAFYDNVLEPLGLSQKIVNPDGGPPASCWISENQLLPRFYVYEPYNGKRAAPGNGVMIAFLAPTERAVSLSYSAALAAGAKDCGKPGPRPRYGQGYFGAYFLDLDGNKIHVVFRRDCKP
ncbi:lactoylglutathione lyase [Tateyamaria omphalii]|uniref:VOC family protein n=1 Tax=Tateyamaria omphalii TaxID=299262 RepID=UPI0016734488|nr:VOC family protein [Tateyamaria omphalii]GGX70985.1 lactoylglutathione lyase [Tateyamaria omphalii]